MRAIIVYEGVRVDGRAMDELRPISCETGILPRVHGSALFTRGETQSLAVTTLGMVGEDDQVLDGIKLDEPAKRFILHYNFPPYSAAPAGARSVTEPWRSARCAPSSPRRTSSPTWSASSPTSWSPTVRARRPASAAAAFR